MKFLILLLNVSFVFSMESYVGFSRQNFGAEFIDNLKKENRARFGKGVRFSSDVMQDMFNLYDPSFLSYVWPKLRTGVHLSVSNACWDDFGVYLKDLMLGRAWAFNGKILIYIFNT